MRNVLFSFLGTTNYKDCVYSWDGTALMKTRFVQTAIYEYLQADVSPLTVIVFVTDTAYNKNWLDVVDDEKGHIEGLESAFKRQLPEATIQYVRIDNPDGEEENWALFDSIFEQIEQEDQIYFDMTHSFRAIPIVSLLVMNYARLLKKAHLRKLVYGQLQGDCGTILDMTNMLGLFDWTNGVDQFIRTGDASKIMGIVREIAGNSYRTNTMSKESKQSLNQLTSVVEKLQQVSLSIQTCRSDMIASDIEALKERIEVAKKTESNFIRPLVPLLDEIESKYANFSTDRIQSGYEAARWSADHELVQIGYTLLQENFITAICHYLKHDEKDRSYRDLINGAIQIIAHDKPKEQWRGDELEIEKLINALPFERAQLLTYSQLTDYRNDINHGGMRPNAIRASRLKNELTAAVENMEALFKMLQR